MTPEGGFVEGPPELPVDFGSAIESGDFDAALHWLTTNVWPIGSSTFDRAVVHVADVMMSVDPATTATLLVPLLRRVDQPLERVHLLQRLMDAYARVKNGAELLATLFELDQVVGQLPADIQIPVLNNVGTFLKDGGEYDAARDALERALRIAGTSICQDRATLLLNLALVHIDRSFRGPQTDPQDAQTAIKILDQAHSLAETLGDARTLGNICFNRGHVEGQLGHAARARYAFEQAAIWFEEAGSASRDMAFVFRAQAASAAKVGHFAEAASLYERARDCFVEEGELDEAARTTVGLLMAMTKSGSTPDGPQLDRLLAAVELSRPGEVPDMLMNLGNIATTAGQPERAFQLFSEAGRRYRQQNQEYDRIRAAHATATSLRIIDRPRAALRLMTVVRHRYVLAGQPLKVAEVDHNLSLVLRDLGDHRAALSAVMAAIGGLDTHRYALSSAEDRARLMTHVYPHAFDLALDLAFRTDADDLIVSLAERARVHTVPRESQVPGTWQLAPPPPIAAYPTANVITGTGAKVDISSVTDSIGGPGATWLSWARHRDRLVRIVMRQGQIDITTVPWPSELLSEVRDAYAITTESDVAVCGDNQTAHRYAILRAASGPLLDDPSLAERFRRTLPTRAREAEAARIIRSQQVLLRDLSRVLLPSSLAGTTVLVMAPIPDFGQIPWAAIPSATVGAATEESSPPLVETADIILVPPLGTLTTTHRPEPAAVPQLVVSDPRGDLPFCRQTPSGDWVVLGGSGNPPATRAALLAHLERSRLLVVRGHVRPGSLADPAATAMLLAGTEELTARDLLSADVRCSSDVVVLGCDASGAATGAEWSGLPIGFGRAGAQRVLVTQWPVIDDPTQEALDLSLVDSVARHGVADGLWGWQRTQAALWRRDPQTAPPYRWASPVMVATSRAAVDLHP